MSNPVPFSSDREHPERIFESWGPHEVSESLVQEILVLVRSDGAFEDEQLLRRGWCVIHAESDGEMDHPDPKSFLQWFEKNVRGPLFVSSRDQLSGMVDHRINAVRLEDPNEHDIVDIDLGLWFFEAAAKPPGYLVPEWANWREQIWFSPGLEFCILNSPGGFGYTVIAGPADLIDAMLLGCTHDSYTWHQGQSPTPWCAR